jgi:hypothetical protein
MIVLCEILRPTNAWGVLCFRNSDMLRRPDMSGHLNKVPRVKKTHRHKKKRMKCYTPDQTTDVVATHKKPRYNRLDDLEYAVATANLCTLRQLLKADRHGENLLHRINLMCLQFWRWDVLDDLEIGLDDEYSREWCELAVKRRDLRAITWIIRQSTYGDEEFIYLEACRQRDDRIMKHLCAKSNDLPSRAILAKCLKQSGEFFRPLLKAILEDDDDDTYLSRNATVIAADASDMDLMEWFIDGDRGDWHADTFMYLLKHADTKEPQTMELLDYAIDNGVLATWEKKFTYSVMRCRSVELRHKMHDAVMASDRPEWDYQEMMRVANTLGDLELLEWARQVAATNPM